tara:strand:- start:4459 stop:4674 length:216 start_codon:yes stop_codon:yes gene_type:complete
MTANEIFEEILKDSILFEKYGIGSETLKKLKLHDRKSDYKIVDVIKYVIEGIENGTPDNSINSQIKNLFSL